MKVFFLHVFIFLQLLAYNQNIKFNLSYAPYNNTSGLHNIFECNHEYFASGISLTDTTSYGIMILKVDSVGVYMSKIIGNQNHLYYGGLNENTIHVSSFMFQTILRKDFNDSIYGNSILINKFSDYDTLWSREVYKDSFTVQTLGLTYLNDFIYAIGTKAFNVDDADHYDAILFKIDSSGNNIWMKKYGGSRMELATKIINTYDNNLLFTARTSSLASANFTGQWIVYKVDTSGAVIWQKNYGNNFLDDKLPYGLIETSDTCYIITGSLAIEKPDAAERIRGRILKIDINGNIIWDKLFGNKTLETYAGIIKEKYNSNLISIVNDGLPNIGYYMIIQELTPLGNIKWFRKYKYSIDPYGFSVLNSFDFTLDGGYIFAGYGTDADSVPAQRSWVIKTDSLGFDGTYYQGDTTLGITLATDTVCYSDSSKIVFHITGKSAPYSLQLSNGNSKNEIYYSPYFESYAYDSLYIYPTDSNTYINFTATVTDPWGKTATENFAVWVKGCSTGVEEAKKGNEMVEIFPNPATTGLHVKIRGVIEGAYTITMYDTQGKTVELITTKELETVIDISKYPQGVYWVRVLGNNIVRSEKIIILKND
jgi:hypothetical protein